MSLCSLDQDLLARSFNNWIQLLLSDQILRSIRIYCYIYQSCLSSELHLESRVPSLFWQCIFIQLICLYFSAILKNYFSTCSIYNFNFKLISSLNSSFSVVYLNTIYFLFNQLTIYSYSLSLSLLTLCSSASKSWCIWSICEFFQFWYCLKVSSLKSSSLLSLDQMYWQSYLIFYKSSMILRF